MYTLLCGYYDIAVYTCTLMYVTNQEVGYEASIEGGVLWVVYSWTCSICTCMLLSYINMQLSNLEGILQCLGPTLGQDTSDVELQLRQHQCHSNGTKAAVTINSPFLYWCLRSWSHELRSCMCSIFFSCSRLYCFCRTATLKGEEAMTTVITQNYYYTCHR